MIFTNFIPLKIYLYYDIHVKSMTIHRFNPDLTKLRGVEKLVEELQPPEEELVTRKSKRDIVEYLLYGVQSN